MASPTQTFQLSDYFETKYHTSVSASAVQSYADSLAYIIAPEIEFTNPKQATFLVSDNGHITFRNHLLMEESYNCAPETEGKARQKWEEFKGQAAKRLATENAKQKVSFPDLFRYCVFRNAEAVYHTKSHDLLYWKLHFDIELPALDINRTQDSIETGHSFTSLSEAAAQVLKKLRKAVLENEWVTAYIGANGYLVGLDFAHLVIESSHNLPILDLKEGWNPHTNLVFLRDDITQAVVAMFVGLAGREKASRLGISVKSPQGFEYELKEGVPRVMFGINDNNNILVAIYPYNYEDYVNGEMVVQYIEKGAYKKRIVPHYLPIGKVKQSYKDYLVQKNEDYAERLKYLKTAFDYIASTTSKDAKKILDILSYNLRNYVVLIPNLSRQSGGGFTDILSACEKTFYRVSFNPDYPIIIYENTNPEKFWGGLSVSVGIIAHELSHVYELAIQTEDNRYLEYETISVSLDSLGYFVQEKWYTITIKLLPNINVILGGVEYKFTPRTWEDHNSMQQNSWGMASAKELFLRKNIIVVGEEFHLSDFSKWIEDDKKDIDKVENNKKDEIKAENDKKDKIKSDIDSILKDFRDWTEYYAVPIQDEFASGLNEKEQKVYEMGNGNNNSLNLRSRATTNPLSKNNPNYIPKANDK